MIDHYFVEKEEEVTFKVNGQKLNHYWGGPIDCAKYSITLADDIKSSASWEATQSFLTFSFSNFDLFAITGIKTENRCRARKSIRV